jgi:FMN-dependent NADH-azoreductase
MSNNSVLSINSSGRYQDSLTRQVSEKLVKQLQQINSNSQIKERDLAKGLPFIDEQWIGANFTDPEQRDPAQKDKLALSDALVAELENASQIVIGSPIYNFSIPAVLKAWVDLVARASLTFRYTENGPEGLLKNKKAYLVMASGGVPISSEMDLATPYLKQALRFIGIEDITVIDATKVDLTQNDNLTELSGA